MKLINRKLIFDVTKDYLNFTSDELENEKYTFDLRNFDGDEPKEYKNISYDVVKKLSNLYKENFGYFFSKIYENFEIENYEFNPIWELLND